MLYSHKIYEPENNRVPPAAANVYVNINQNLLIIAAAIVHYVVQP